MILFLSFILIPMPGMTIQPALRNNSTGEQNNPAWDTNTDTLQR
jgi:hypothetical protein